MNPVQLSIFANRLSGICDEMGALLRRCALSPNIKDRLDFSCAIFDAHGELCAQAAHIPVHLGSMAYAMRDLVAGRDWQPGSLLVVNDPYLGGTHLPDVTVVAPVFCGDGPDPVAFTVTRAHHANIGAQAPGSMPVSRHLDEEGIVIAPQWLRRQGAWAMPLVRRLVDDAETAAPEETPRFADFVAQASACEAGGRWLAALLAERGLAWFEHGVVALNAYGERLTQQLLAGMPDGHYTFTDYLDDDGQGTLDIPVVVSIRVGGERAHVDFTGTSDQVAGNINCPLSVAAAAVYYCFRCLLPASVPACAGLFRPVTLGAPAGSLVNARRPAAVAAGNVETSSRIVDAVLGALAAAIPERIPAASHGTMNNLAMGAHAQTQGDGPGWDYYETMGGGMGASARAAGLSGVQTHMTNTLNTPIESLEQHYPLRVWRYALRRGSGGAGLHVGGDGLIRELEFLAPAQVTLLTERRTHAPWGMAGGAAGQPGENRFNGRLLPGKTTFHARQGDRLVMASPGAGGWGR
ncbi:hydantoinase B/oxoprolinase family protein [Alcanivorax sp. JB21]|uniref:hydantoinase B/oxoprolinase family protein n=1 Tax=Alcanivorax limicola TaxID=2874102 RepID=UPI001CBC6D23|nr:hydantoinase B/oxoprolinase family protein [Alcanivorax limicola]MBZ2189798.1 hydantoinase B/oxoprolinase family protein [Alcanivorax limicola]